MEITKNQKRFRSKDDDIDIDIDLPRKWERKSKLGQMNFCAEMQLLTQTSINFGEQIGSIRIAANLSEITGQNWWLHFLKVLNFFKGLKGFKWSFQTPD